MRLFDVAEIDAALSYPGLIDILDDAFRSEVIAPKRGQYAIQRPDETDAILLTMPAWSGPDVANPYIGTKIVSVFFGNGKRNLPGVMGAYLLMDGATGKPLAVMDGNRLTTWRTAAASALASRYMSNPESSRMLMVGAGALAPFIIKAHRSVRPLTEIAICSSASAPRGTSRRRSARPRTRSPTSTTTSCGMPRRCAVRRASAIRPSR